MPQQTSSEAPMVLSAGPSVMPLNQVFSVNKEHHLPGAGLLNPNIPDLQSPTEPAVSASEQGPGPSQLEGISSEQRLSKALSIIAVSSPTSLNPHQEGPQSSSSTQPIVEGITVVTSDFLKYVDNQLFATESQEAVSLGNTPSSYINTKEMLTASPRTEKAETDAAKMPAFPGVDSTADTEPDGERPSEESDDNVQTTITTYLEATPEDVLNIVPTADSLLGELKVTVKEDENEKDEDEEEEDGENQVTPCIIISMVTLNNQGLLFLASWESSKPSLSSDCMKMPLSIE
ncbi:Armadillo-like helical domain-containing protein 4 [Lemmus lemmus]